MKWILSKKITRAAKASELGDFKFRALRFSWRDVFIVLWAA
jgi:hypothetical protein